VQAQYVLGPALEFQGVGLNGALPAPVRVLARPVAAGGVTSPGRGKEGGAVRGWAQGSFSVLPGDGGLLGTPHRLHIVGYGWRGVAPREYFCFPLPFLPRKAAGFCNRGDAPPRVANRRARQAKRECTQTINTLQRMLHSR